MGLEVAGVAPGLQVDDAERARCGSAAKEVRSFDRFWMDVVS